MSNSIDDQDVAPKSWADRQLAVFIVIHFFVWLVLPLLRGVPHVDSLEAVLWGELPEWGTDKHPPLSGWLVQIAYRLTGSLDLSIYLTSQLCVVVAFIFIYKLALLYVPPDKAALSVMFLEGIRYYGYYSGFYNVNVVSLMLVPIIIYCCKRAVDEDSYRYWLGLGLAGGLSMLTKYTNGLVLFCLGLFLLFTIEGRARLRRPGPYLSVLTAFLVFLPHLLWLKRHDFAPFSYFSSRATDDVDSFREGVLVAADNVHDEIFIVLGALICLALLYWPAPKNDKGPARPVPKFLVYAGILPYAVTIAIIFLTRVEDHAQWPYAFMSCLPLLFFVRFPLKLGAAARRRGVILAYVAMAIIGGVHFSYSVRKNSPTFNMDRAAYVKLVEGLWDKYTDAPLSYVGGDWTYPCFAASFLPERPKLFFPGRSVWIDVNDVREKGLLLLTRTPGELEAYRAAFPGLIGNDGKVDFEIHNWSGEGKLFTILYAVMPPGPAISSNRENGDVR